MQRHSAFTFIELTIMLLILGILAGVAAPKYSDSLARFRVEAASKRLAADMRYASNLARRNATIQSIHFSLDDNSYRLANARDIDHSDLEYKVSFAEKGYPVAISSVTFGGFSDLSFDHLGNVIVTGSVTLRSGAHQRTISVQPPNIVSIGP